MNNLAFTRLISSLTDWAGKSMSLNEIKHFETEVKDCVEQPRDTFLTTTQIRNEVDTLFRAYRQCSKIEAIKAYRTLTGYGLKESKDAVEDLIKDCHANYSSEGLSKA